MAICLYTHILYIFSYIRRKYIHICTICSIPIKNRQKALKIKGFRTEQMYWKYLFHICSTRCSNSYWRSTCSGGNIVRKIPDNQEPNGINAEILGHGHKQQHKGQHYQHFLHRCFTAVLAISMATAIPLKSHSSPSTSKVSPSAFFRTAV